MKKSFFLLFIAGILVIVLLVIGCPQGGSSSGGGGGGGKKESILQNVWTWVSGDNIVSQPGVYGTKGTADPSNKPGSRQNAVSWIDSDNNLWLFGSDGYDSAGISGRLNDLWKYDGTNWTWVSGNNIVDQTGIYGTKGIADTSNKPGSRSGAVSWIDSNNNLWLFGGYGLDSTAAGRLNDLWKYDGTNWTWISGDNIVNKTGVYGTKGIADPLNKPGSRELAVSWIDSNNNLWLFGGYGLDNTAAGRLNDLWKYDGTNWTWASGDNTVNQTGVYGTKGTADPLNKPGSRELAVSWIDSSNNLWLFGGAGFVSAVSFGLLNDLWKYDGTNWTWVSGDNTINQAGIYGTKGIASPSNKPGGRREAISWIDSSNNLWLFGGDGYVSAVSVGLLNDLWKYDGTNWTWISGDNIRNQTGIYGTKGTAKPSNKPGSRYYSISWIDSSNNLWLFGGWGYDSSGTEGYLNDLWKFKK